jgi:hypothetical protein
MTNKPLTMRQVIELGGEGELERLKLLMPALFNEELHCWVSKYNKTTFYWFRDAATTEATIHRLPRGSVSVVASLEMLELLELGIDPWRVVWAPPRNK